MNHSARSSPKKKISFGPTSASAPTSPHKSADPAAELASMAFKTEVKFTRVHVPPMYPGAILGIPLPDEDVENAVARGILRMCNRKSLPSAAELNNASGQSTCFEEVTDVNEMMRHRRHAAHIVLWSKGRDTDLLLGKYLLKHRVLMQLRFDGSFGFPGGIIDEVKQLDLEKTDCDEFFDLIKIGLIREVEEEMMFPLHFEPKYHFTTLLKSEKATMLHCFSAELSLDTMEMIESNFSSILKSDEVLGIVRVPLFILPEKYANRGLPTFLSNSFAGNGKEQLLRVCTEEKLLSEEDALEALRIIESVKIQRS